MQNSDINNNSINKFQLKMAIVFLLTFTFFIVEILGGLLSNSLTLLADAGHMFQDLLALSLAMISFYLYKKPTNLDHSFGFKRTEILAAFINGIFLLIVSFYLLFEAFTRLNKPEVIDSKIMFGVSTIGLIVNFIGVLILFKSSNENLNVKAVFLHGLSDTLGSIGALIASVMILLTGNSIYDFLMTIFITILITFSSFNLLRRSVHILLEATPEDIDITTIKTDLLNIAGVLNIHDLHIWSLSSKDYCFSGHIVITPNTSSCDIIEICNNILKEKHLIYHPTLQIEHLTYFKKCNSCV